MEECIQRCRRRKIEKIKKKENKKCMCISSQEILTRRLNHLISEYILYEINVKLSK